MAKNNLFSKYMRNLFAFKTFNGLDLIRSHSQKTIMEFLDPACYKTFK